MFSIMALILFFTSLVSGEILNGLGIVYNKLGMSLESKKYYEMSLQIASRHYSVGHSIIASMHNNLGSVSFNLKDFKSSANHFEKAIAMLEKIDENEICDILSNLSVRESCMRSINGIINKLFFDRWCTWRSESMRKVRVVCSGHCQFLKNEGVYKTLD